MSDLLAEVIAHAMGWSAHRPDAVTAEVKANIAIVLDAQRGDWDLVFSDDAEAMHLIQVLFDGVRAALLGTTEEAQ